MITKKKNLKPISSDVHFKYRCPNSDCTIEHWLSIKETQTKDFKVVCDCDTIFQPKKISKIKILYSKPKTKKEIPVDTEIVNKKPELADREIVKIPIDLLDRSAKILSTYGFTDKEARELLVDAYDKIKTENIGNLVKYTLETFGGKHG
jgi:hypothetical protein